MTKRTTQHNASAHKRDWPVIALALNPNHWIHEEAVSRGWRLINLASYEGKLPQGIVPRGALVSFMPDDPLVLKLQESGCAVVRIGMWPHPLDWRLPAVLPDPVAAGRLAAQHFAERGFRHVGYVGSDPWSDFKPFADGFQGGAKELRLAFHLSRFKVQSGEAKEAKQDRKQGEFTKWLREVPKPLGLLSSSDGIASKHILWTMAAGFSVPADVAICGTGNNRDVCECCMPTITSLDLNEERRSRTACELLARLMAGGKAPRSAIMIPPLGIVERESTNVLATPDRHVAEALRYLWGHLDLNLSVDDVARVVGLSSRQMARRFHHALGRGINEEMRRKRLEETQRLLRTTDRSIADIAPMVGFRSTAYLHRAFRAAFGLTPRRYRVG